METLRSSGSMTMMDGSMTIGRSGRRDASFKVRANPLGRLLAAALAACALLGAAGCGDAEYGFAPIAIGDDQAGRTPKARSNAQFVRAVYADLIGRAPEAYDFNVTYGGQPGFSFQVDENGFLVDALDGMGDPDALRAVIVAGLVNSSEVSFPEKSEVADPAAFITEQFRRFLGRDPGAYELAAFESEWKADPAVGPKTVVRALIGSREYQSQ
jgi:hypothetical protein